MKKQLIILLTILDGICYAQVGPFLLTAPQVSSGGGGGLHFGLGCE